MKNKYKCNRCGFIIETDSVINFGQYCVKCMKKGYKEGRLSQMIPILGK